MPKLVAVYASTHGQKVWRRPANYLFAAKEAVAPIVLAEIGHVGSWMPIAFIQQAGRYVPSAMMCPMPEHNLFIGPEGQWLAVTCPPRCGAIRSGCFGPKVQSKWLCVLTKTVGS